MEPRPGDGAPKKSWDDSLTLRVVRDMLDRSARPVGGRFDEGLPMSTLQKPKVLSEDQRRRVEQHRGLVAMHLRRHAAKYGVWRHKHDWADLYQEGCLGLIEAALHYSEGCGIPFPLYALPRIQRAVSDAIRHSATTALEVRPARNRFGPIQPVRLPDRRRPHPDPDGHTSVGRRLHDKCLRALDRAKSDVSLGISPRGDRGQLVNLLLEQRWRIPDSRHKTALREIARRTKSSIARVIQCDKRLARFAKEALEHDPEFDTLRRLIKTMPDGADSAVDCQVEGQLAQSSAKEFERRFSQACAADRERLLRLWRRFTRFDLDALMSDTVRRLPPKARERLWRASQPRRAAKARPDRTRERQKPLRHDAPPASSR